REHPGVPANASEAAMSFMSSRRCQFTGSWIPAVIPGCEASSSSSPRQKAWCAAAARLSSVGAGSEFEGKRIVIAPSAMARRAAGELALVAHVIFALQLAAARELIDGR